VNLHTLVAGNVGAVNKFIPLNIRISTGDVKDSNYKPVPSYATPGSITASIVGTVMTVSAVSVGKLMKGQLLADDPAVLLPGTIITGQLTGEDGGVGTYSVNQSQSVSSEAMTTAVVRPGQVQPITWRDLQLLDGINLQGTRAKIFVYGQVEGLVRVDKRGGDLITFPDGKVWLVAQVLEGWHTAGWCSVAATLQNGS